MKIAVTADIHADDLGSRIDAATGLNARFQDAIDMVAWIAGDARERGCDLLAVLGDFSENRHPAPWRVAMIRDALAAFGGPYLLLRGNHDGFRSDRCVVDVLAASLPAASGFSARPGLAFFGTTAIVAVPFLDRHFLRAQPGFEHTPDAEVFRVLGEQYLTIARGLFVEAQEGGARTVLFVGHQTAAGGQMSETQQAFLGDMSLVVDAGAIKAIGYDAVAFGHLHRGQELAPGIFYPGSPCRVDFGEEKEIKRYVIVDTERLPAIVSIEAPARRFVTVDYSAEATSFPDVEDAIVRAVNVPADVAPDDIRKAMELAGAWDITEIRRRPVVIPESIGGMSESLSPSDALEAFFKGDEDYAGLIEDGRRILSEVA